MNKKTLILVLIFCCLLILVLITGYFVFFKEQKIDISQENLNQSNGQFLEWKNSTKKLPQKTEEVFLIAVGDISFSRSVERVINAQKDINYPFLKIQDYLSGNDIVFGNLETPITIGREIMTGEMIFRSNPGTEKALKKAGFSILSLANNHTMNFNQKGLLDTLNYLEQAGIKYVGAGENEEQAYQPIYIDSKGIKFAFLAYNNPILVPQSYEAEKNRPGIAFMKVENMKKAIIETKQKVDFVIISIHGGTEYTNELNSFQVNFAHSAIDAGADLVIGHHPHVIQKLEKYKGKYIFYSLGNFVFDQMWSQETRQGLIIKAYFSKDGINKISLLPVIIENFSQPRPANEQETEVILQKLNFPLAKRLSYFYNENVFEKIFRNVIYNELFDSKSNIFKELFRDLDNDSTQEKYILTNGQLTVTEKDQTIWQSPENWWIDDFILADSTNDGIIDINLSVWKSGNYGDIKPFWVKENDLSIKNHFFVFNLENKTVKPVWQSSNLVDQNQEIAIADIDKDNKNELIVIEAGYSNKEICKNNYVAVWKWNDWGFTSEWQSEKGNFCNLEIESIDGKKHIIVDSF